MVQNRLEVDAYLNCTKMINCFAENAEIMHTYC